MQELKITGEVPGTTGISNIFIDHYMADANGEFVKLYLYLVRLSAAGRPVSIQILADDLASSEKNVCRAIKYWVSKGVLRLSYADEEKKVASGIILAALKVPEAAETDMLFLTEEAREEDQPAPALPEVPEKTKLTPKALRELTRDENLENLIHEAEAYFNHMLTPTELNSLHYIYKELGFSFDLSEFLLEYTASIGKTSFRYMEAVAREWYQQKIRTRAAAESYTLNFNALYQAVQKELGLPFGSVTTATKDYADRWSREYGFTKEIILEACRRTVKKNAKRPLEYADGILKDWYKNNVRRFSDIARQDAGHRASRPEPEKKASVPAAKKASFPQTDMTAQMKEIEEMYLNIAN